MDQEHEYFHFTNMDQCKSYLRNNPHIVISHLCCGGNGYAVKIISDVQVIPKNKDKKYKTLKGTCDICFLDNVTLHYTCTSCKQPFCMECLQKLPTKTCPYCRSPL